MAATALMAAVAFVPAMFVLREAIRLTSNRIQNRRYPPPGRMIDVGGFRLHMYCTGQGSPTVVFESGLGTNWADWSAVLPAVSSKARACVYDRAGYGWSEASPLPRTAANIAEELHRLLIIGGEQRPFVLVGHSFGGFTTRLFASSHPLDTAGLVLVDPSHEDIPERPAPAQPRFGWRGLGYSRLVKLWRGDSARLLDPDPIEEAVNRRRVVWSPPAQLESEAGELTDMQQSVAQVRAARLPPGVPITVITAALPANPSPGLKFREECHRRLSHSPEGRHLIASRGGHFIQIDDPDLVTQSILDMVARVRRRQSMQGDSERTRI